MSTIHDTVFYTLSMLAKANVTKDSTDLFKMLHPLLHCIYYCRAQEKHQLYVLLVACLKIVSQTD